MEQNGKLPRAVFLQHADKQLQSSLKNTTSIVNKNLKINCAQLIVFALQQTVGLQGDVAFC